MPIDALHTARAVSTDAPCAHCGLPVGAYPIGDGPHFCCVGCAMVFDALQAAGFDQTYYQFRNLSPQNTNTQPASPSVDAFRLSEFDTPSFLRKHTKLVRDGVRQIDLFLDGVHCAACVWLVERLPYELEGVLTARLDLPRARLSLTWRQNETQLSEVGAWLGRFGYTAHPLRLQQSTERSVTEKKLLIKLGICWALAGNVMLLSFALYSGLDYALHPKLTAFAHWISLLLALPAVFYGGSEFFQRAGLSLHMAWNRRTFRHLHMDTPIALGILVGFTNSTWATLTQQGTVWFDSITVLIAALLTARWLHLRSRRLAGEASDRLLSLLPTLARRITPTGSLEAVAADELAKDDLIEVRAGDVFPADGIIVQGVSTINNAVLTGESKPISIEEGTHVEAGATNITSSVHLRVQAGGTGTRIGQLLAWVQDRPADHSSFASLADRLSGYFVISVLTLAVLTAGLWLFLDPSRVTANVVALLVITCPCALGMATPLAMAVASGKAARRGLFIKSDSALEALTHVNTLVLDKTGTLTEGHMTLVDYTGNETALDLAAHLETQSHHPIGVALVRARLSCPIGDTTDILPKPDNYQHISGHGVQGTVDGKTLAVGRPEWIAAQTQAFPIHFASAITTYVRQGYTPIAIAVDHIVQAVCAFGDPLRSSSQTILDRFRTEEKNIYILSGDHPEVVQKVAAQLGVPSSHALGDITPEGKRQFIEQLQKQTSHPIAMIGDGVNDAAALQIAEVGIAVQGGTTASLVAADIFLTRPGLQPVLELVEGARHVMRVIKRGLGISLVYNLLGATAALMGLVNPLVAAIAMPLSSLLVVTSSIAQQSFKPRESSYQHPTLGSATSLDQTYRPTGS